jgi:hypothetical protein
VSLDCGELTEDLVNRGCQPGVVKDGWSHGVFQPWCGCISLIVAPIPIICSQFLAGNITSVLVREMTVKERLLIFEYGSEAVVGGRCIFIIQDPIYP